MCDLQPDVISQPAVADVDGVGRALQDAFATMRDAVAADRPIVVVVRDEDLLGQRGPEDAALASALLGMVRALAMEGVRHGRRVNAVSHSGEDAPHETIRWMAEGPVLSGQLVRVTTDHLGRVWP